VEHIIALSVISDRLHYLYAANYSIWLEYGLGLGSLFCADVPLSNYSLTARVRFNVQIKYSNSMIFFKNSLSAS